MGACGSYTHATISMPSALQVLAKRQLQASEQRCRCASVKHSGDGREAEHQLSTAPLKTAVYGQKHGLLRPPGEW